MVNKKSYATHLNKKRTGFRGSKKRQSIYRNEYNKKLEEINEKFCRELLDNSEELYDKFKLIKKDPWKYIFDNYAAYNNVKIKIFGGSFKMTESKKLHSGSFFVEK